MLARSLFSALGAECYVIGNEPNGLNVNDCCGSTHIDRLVKLVRENHLDLGFAFDGDCDRCIAVDERGRVVDGDGIMYILAKRLLERDGLNGNTVVSTTMSNSGLDRALRELGVRCVRTDVGDRYVYECMQNNDYSLGGEQSGHIILKKYATTGDGLLTAIMLTEEMCDKKCTLGELTGGLDLYPQYTVNVRVVDKSAVMQDADVLCELHSVEREIGENGRALLRKSGTEPVVRVMIECNGSDKAVMYAERIASKIIEKGYGV